MTKPVPAVTPLSEPFWKAAAQHELRMQKCGACGHIRFPIGPVCTVCLSSETSWVPVGLTAKVLAHLVFHRGYSADWREEVPYSVLMVQLPEGPRMFLDLLDPEKRHTEDELTGQDIRIVFEPVSDDIAVPRAQAQHVG